MAQQLRSGCCVGMVIVEYLRVRSNNIITYHSHQGIQIKGDHTF